MARQKHRQIRSERHRRTKKPTVRLPKWFAFYVVAAFSTVSALLTYARGPSFVAVAGVACVLVVITLVANDKRGLNRWRADKRTRSRKTKLAQWEVLGLVVLLILNIFVIGLAVV